MGQRIGDSCIGAPAWFAFLFFYDRPATRSASELGSGTKAAESMLAIQTSEFPSGLVP